MTDERYSPVSIQALPALRVARYRAISASPEEDAGRIITGWLARQAVAGPVRHFGFDVETTPEQQAAGVRGYEVWRTVPAGVAPSEGVTLHDFDGGLYAAMTCFKPFDDPFTWIPAGWNRLQQWVEARPDYRLGGHQWLEELIESPDGEDLVLYCPIAAAVPEN